MQLQYPPDQQEKLRKLGVGTMINIVMFPWLAHGHVSPFLELAKRLTKKNFFIHFCSTPVILNSIKKKITKEESLCLELVEIHLPEHPDLPPHRHTTNGLPNHLIPTLTQALQMASSSYTSILETTKPDLVIYDYNQPWIPSMSASLNIPAMHFAIVGISMVTFGIHLAKNPDMDFPCRDIQPRYFKDFVFRGASYAPGKSDTDRSNFFNPIYESHEMILVKSFRELEGESMDYLSRLIGKKVLPVGPLVESAVDGYESNEIIEWLDKKDKRSTVYCSFGSECFLTKEEIQGVAHGLELSNVNFIWALRFAVGEEMDLDEVLPEGFLKRVGERGKVINGWAPQLKILGHPSIGGFVSHCGWNGMLESIESGVPIIALPLHLDQPYHAKLAEDRGVAIEVWRGEDLGIKGEELANTIKKVIVDDQQEPLRVKTRDLAKIMKVREKEDLDMVVKELEKICTKA